jgi:hypothetical protein
MCLVGHCQVLDPKISSSPHLYLYTCGPRLPSGPNPFLMPLNALCIRPPVLRNEDESILLSQTISRSGQLQILGNLPILRGTTVRPP